MFKLRSTILKDGCNRLRGCNRFFRVLILAKCSRNHRDRARRIFRLYDCISAKMDNNLMVPVHENVNTDGFVVDYWEVFIPVVEFPKLRQYFDYYDLKVDKHNPFVRIEKIVHIRVPHGMGKLSSFADANTKLQSFSHDTGMHSPTNKDITIPLPNTQRKQKAKPVVSFRQKRTGNYGIIVRERKKNRMAITMAKNIVRAEQ